MSISSQLPPILVPAGGSALQALAQAAGSTVDAKVLGQQPNGTTHVQIGRQLLNLQLPEPATQGTTLTLAVRQAEGQLTLTLLAATAPSGVTAGVGPGVLPDAPAATVQLSPAAISAEGRAPTVVAAGSMPAQPVRSDAPASSVPAPAAAQAHSPQAGVQPTAAVGGAAATPVSAVVSPVSAAPSQATAPSAPVPISSTPDTRSAAPVSQAAAPVVAASASPVGRPAIPYPVAAPVVTVPQAVPAPTQQAAGAPVPVGQVLPAAGVNSGTVSFPPPGAQTPNSPSPAQASTPQAALAQMVQRAVSSQDSIVGLTTALVSTVGKVALPEPVLKAAQLVLAQRLSLDGRKLDGAAVQRAVLNSGLFQEAKLASGQPATASTDLKTAMLGLQRSLGNWVGSQAAVEPVSALPPPVRGMVPRARAGDVPPLDMQEDPVEAGKVLLERTEASLARLRLHQNASLPEAPQRQEAQWSLDLPVTIAGQQNVLQLQIHRDAEEARGGADDRGWQVRFAINLGEPGEVGAQISLRSGSAGVMIWADDAQTAEALNSGIDSLRQELAAVGLRPGSVLVRSGVPASPAAAPSRHLLDETR
jgi:hypothetical protein